ncbi:MAG: hypothetical protein ACJATE_000016 [Bacteroidia bacterium]|jgi:hypothetical protein
MKKTILLFLIFTSFFFITEVLAQTPVPGGNPNEGAPIDGFSSLLLLAGIGYSIHRMQKKTVTNTHPEK